MTITQNNINANTTTPLSGGSGGTGVNNGNSTITLGGSLITSGAFATTITTTATTSVTLPTSGKIMNTGISYSIGNHLFIN